MIETKIEDRPRSANSMAADIGSQIRADAGLPACAGETPRGYLRRVTRPWHEGVEAAFERFDLQTVEGLSCFLLRQAMALLPIEAALEATGIATLFPDWPRRCRGALLRADLHALGVPAPEPEPDRDLVVLESLSMLGALYVLEGSKLGGRMLHRRVLASSDSHARAATRFLGHRHDGGWTSFLAVLDRAPRDLGALQAMASGAEIAFASFHAAAIGVPLQTADASSGLDHYLPAHV